MLLVLHWDACNVNNPCCGLAVVGQKSDLSRCCMECLKVSHPDYPDHDNWKEKAESPSYTGNTQLNPSWPDCCG